MSQTIVKQYLLCFPFMKHEVIEDQQKHDQHEEFEFYEKVKLVRSTITYIIYNDSILF